MSETNQHSLTLYAYTFPSRAERVIWTLNELTLEYDVIRLDPFKGETLTDEFLAMNPGAKIPVLVHGDRVLTESLAIMEYLDDLNPKISLLPETAEERYRFRHLISYLATEVEAYLWIANQASVLKQIYNWPEGTLEEAVKRVQKNINPVLKWVTQSSYAVGERFTMVDIYAVQVLGWAKGYGIEIPKDIKEYVDRLRSRPAYPRDASS